MGWSRADTRTWFVYGSASEKYGAGASVLLGSDSRTVAWGERVRGAGRRGASRSSGTTYADTSCADEYVTMVVPSAVHCAVSKYPRTSPAALPGEGAEEGAPLSPDVVEAVMSPVDATRSTLGRDAPGPGWPSSIMGNFDTPGRSTTTQLEN